MTFSVAEDEGEGVWRAVCDHCQVEAGHDAVVLWDPSSDGSQVLVACQHHRIELAAAFPGQPRAVPVDDWVATHVGPLA